MKKQKFRDSGTPSRSAAQHLGSCGRLEERDDGVLAVRVIVAVDAKNHRLG